jgi:hypothetical protein
MSRLLATFAIADIESCGQQYESKDWKQDYECSAFRNGSQPTIAAP